jgi:hypothetical protein
VVDSKEILHVCLLPGVLARDSAFIKRLQFVN